MYIVHGMTRSQVVTSDKIEGETIETKVERMISNKEPIKDGAPEIFTERKDGVISAYNIRSDRWEIACDAMDVVSRNIQAKREDRMKPKEEVKVVKLEEEKMEIGDQSTQGNSE